MTNKPSAPDLPPLPPPAHPTHALGPLWTADQMRDYAHAAVHPAPVAAPEPTQTNKEAWWAGYRAGKGLPADTPRQDAVAAPAPAPDEIVVLADTMAQRLADYLHSLGDGGDVRTEYTDSRAALRAAVEQLAKDAERYRWLRTGAGGCFTDPGDFWGQSDDEIDAAIDAAMREGK